MQREHVRFRPKTDEDDPFLLYLYATTRAHEMAMVEWTDQQKVEFLTMQFRAQKEYYETQYDNCEFLVLETLEGQPVGRLYIDRAPHDIRIVDIALLPEIRGKGLGRVLLQEIIDEAAATNRAVTIHVEIFNPALHLYYRLGFQDVETNGVYKLMEWRAPVAAAEPSAT